MQSPQSPVRSGLSVNKILAGAAAAATAAVAGSYFGVAGTVVGAAIASAITTIGAALYQVSLDRTQRTVRTRLLTGPRGANGAEDDPETDTAPDAGPAPVRHRLPVLAGATLLVFLGGLLAVTGIELVRGSVLSGGSGTTIERVVSGPATSPTTTVLVPPPVTETVTEAPTTDPVAPSGSVDPSGTAGDPLGGTAVPSVGPSPSGTPTTSAGPPTTTPAPVG